MNPFFYMYNFLLSIPAVNGMDGPPPTESFFLPDILCNCEYFEPIQVSYVCSNNDV